MRGQVRIEFIFGLMLFILLILFIISQTNVLFSSLITDSKSDKLKAKAVNSVKILVEDKGDPENWQILAPGSIRRIGLVNDIPYNLSMQKINRLKGWCALATIPTVLENFELKAYRLKISNSTHQLLMCGFDSLEPATAIEVKKVHINGDIGTVSLELW